MARVAWMCGTLVLMSGCRGTLNPPATAEWSDSGRLCIVPEQFADDVVAGTLPETIDFEADQDLVAVITFSDCETCTRSVQANCEVLDGPVPQLVESEASYIVDDSRCNESCEPVVAMCDVGAFEPGARSYRHGGSILVLEVPSTSDRFCAGEPIEPELQGE